MVALLFSSPPFSFSFPSFLSLPYIHSNPSPLVSFLLRTFRRVSFHSFFHSIAGNSFTLSAATVLSVLSFLQPRLSFFYESSPAPPVSRIDREIRQLSTDSDLLLFKEKTINYSVHDRQVHVLFGNIVSIRFLHNLSKISAQPS